MSGKGRKSGPRKTAKGTAAENARRRRQAELLRTNLLKRKEQSRNRRTGGTPASESGDDPARG